MTSDDLVQNHVGLTQLVGGSRFPSLCGKTYRPAEADRPVLLYKPFLRDQLFTATEDEGMAVVHYYFENNFVGEALRMTKTPWNPRPGSQALAGRPFKKRWSPEWM